MKRSLSACSSPPSYYVATSPSNRLYDKTRKRQKTTNQPKRPTSTQPSLHQPTSLYDRLTGEQSNSSKVIATESNRPLRNGQEGARTPTSRYLLPTASSLQRRLSLSSDIGANKKNSRQDSPSIQRYETITSKSTGHDRQAELKASVLVLEQDDQAIDRQQWLEEESLMKLYGRYLQWEWLALKMEKTIRSRQLLVENQLRAVMNSYKQLNQAPPQGNDKINQWMETYLVDVEKDLALMENQELTTDITASCLSRLNIAKAQLDRLMDEGLPYSVYKENMDIINDSISCIEKVNVDTTTDDNLL